MEVRILHAADFHLDTSYDALPEEKARQRRQEARELLGRLAETAERERSQVVLLAGDLFDTGAAYWETQEMLLKLFSDLRAEVFIAPGNHDYYAPRSPYGVMPLPENVHVFKTPDIKSFELPALGCRVWGAGFTAPVCDPILRGFRLGETGLTELMVLHGEMNGDRYAPLTEAQIEASGLSYLALGHEHTFSGIRRAGKTAWAYAGCLEGRGFDETGEKGVIVGTVSRTAADLRFVPLGGRQYELLPVDLTGVSDAVEAVLAAAGPERGSIVRVILRGEFAGAVSREAVLRALEGHFYHTELRDETVPTRDVWEGAGEDNLRGLFLKRIREAYDAADTDRDREKYLLAARYGIAALEKREVWRP